MAVIIPIKITEFFYKKVGVKYLELIGKPMDKITEARADYFKSSQSKSEKLGYVLNNELQKKGHYISYQFTYPFLYKPLKNGEPYKIVKPKDVEKINLFIEFIGFDELNDFVTEIKKKFPNEDLRFLQVLSSTEKLDNSKKNYIFNEEEDTPSGHFWCFLSGKDGIRKGKIGVYRGGRICLLIVEKNKKEYYYGKIQKSKHNKTTVIVLKRKSRRHDNYKAILCFKTDGHKLGFDSEQDFFYGTYAGFSAEDSSPVSGMVIIDAPNKCKKKDLLELSFNDLNIPSKNDVSSLYYYLLSSQRQEADQKPLLDNTYIHRYESAFKYSNKYWKVYSVIGNEIHTHACRIKENLTVSWKSPSYELNGSFRKISNEQIDSLTLRNKSKSQIWHIILESNSDNEEYVIGTCTGVRSNNIPFFSNLIFKQISEEEYHNLNPIVALVENNPKLSKKLASIYSENKRTITGFQPDLFSVNRKNNSDSNGKTYSNIEGSYYAVYLNHEKQNSPYYKCIHVNKMKIDKTGNVEMYSTRFVEDKTYYDGEAKVNENGVLVINLKSNTTPDIVIQKIFSNKFIGANYFSGVFSTYTKNGSQPICGREYLIKAKDENFQPTILQLNSKEMKDFLNRNIEVSNRNIFNEILVGPSDNYIKGINNSITRRDNYGELYFTSACYFAKKIKSSKADKKLVGKVLNLVQQSFIHGYNDAENFKKEIESEEGSLFMLNTFIDTKELTVY